MQKALSGFVGLHPLAIDDELRDGALANIAKNLVSGARGVLDINLFVRNLVLSEKTLCFAAIAAPGGGVEGQVHEFILGESGCGEWSAEKHYPIWGEQKDKDKTTKPRVAKPKDEGGLLLVVVADEAAIDEVGGSGDVGAFGGGEEGGDTGDFFRLSDAAERNVSEQGVELRLVGHEI